MSTELADLKWFNTILYIKFSKFNFSKFNRIEIRLRMIAENNCGSTQNNWGSIKCKF